MRKILTIIALTLILLAPQAYSQEFRPVPVQLGKPVFVPAIVPQRPETPPVLLLLGPIAVTLFPDPAEPDRAVYGELYDLSKEATLMVSWRIGELEFTVVDEGWLKDGVPIGKLIFPPPELKETL